MFWDIVRRKQSLFQILFLLVFIPTLLDSLSIEDEKDCQKRIVGYVSSFEKNITERGAKKLTHIVYPFVFLIKNKSFVFDYSKDQKIKRKSKMMLENLFSLRRVNPNLKIMFGFSRFLKLKDFVELLSVEETSDKFISEIVNIIDVYGFDGVDFGWELTTPNEHLEVERDLPAYYSVLIRKTRNKFDEYVKKNKRNGKLLISMAIPDVESVIESKIYIAYQRKYIDFFNVHILKSSDKWTFKTSPSKIQNQTYPYRKHGPDTNSTYIDSNIRILFCLIKNLDQINLNIPLSKEFLEEGGEKMNKEGRIIHVGGFFRWHIDKIVTSNQGTNASRIFINQPSINGTMRYAGEKNLGGIVIWGIELEDDNNLIMDSINPFNLCSHKKIEETYDCSLPTLDQYVEFK